MTYSAEAFEAMERDPRREAGYYSERARYFRLKAARLRDRKRRGFILTDEGFSPDSCEMLSDVLNEWARLTAASGRANPSRAGIRPAPRRRKR